MQKIASTYPLPFFFAGTYLFSWTCFFLAANGEGVFGPLVLLGGFGPPLIALLTAHLCGGSGLADLLRGILRWRVAGKWYAFALLLPPGLYALAMLVLWFFGDYMVPAGAPSIGVYPLMLLGVALIGGGQEEVGWRGFALPRLQRHMQPLTASIVLGLLWVVWHLPLFFMPGTPQVAIPLLPYVVYTLGISIIMTWLFNASGGSTLLAILFHAGVNVPSAWYPLGLCVGGLNSAGLLALLVWIVVTILVLRNDTYLGGSQ